MKGSKTKASLDKGSKKGEKPKKNIKKAIWSSLPESIENLGVVQQAADIFAEIESRAGDVKDEAKKEIKKLMKIYGGSFSALEKNVHRVTKEAKKQAQTGMLHLVQKWHEGKQKLPKTLVDEVEKLVGKIGEKTMKKIQSSPIKKAKKPTKKIVKKPKAISKEEKEAPGPF